MKLLRLNYLFIFFIFFLPSYSQDFIPVEILQALENGTRVLSGRPGENYFQNYTDYTIDVNFDAENGSLRGKATIRYHNKSAEALNKVVFRLYQNIARKGGIRDEEIPQQDIHSGVQVSRLKINGINHTEEMDKIVSYAGTNMIVFLPETLSASDSVEFEIRWKVNMPSTHLHRFGQYAENTHFVSFWYPQIAVYDDIEGWDMHNYTGTHEFYNDFSNFNVSIRVPGSCMVWATGELMNAKTIFSSKILSRLEKVENSSEVIQLITPEDLETQEHLLNKRGNTFQFIARSVPDFAFAVSDSYLWDAISVRNDSIDGGSTFVSAAYPEGAANFDSVAFYGSQVIKHFSDSSYRVTFPFPSMTVFNGDGGMEYPMIVNDGTVYSYEGTFFLTMHEIAHTYFPFLVGINERRYSWMDEGLTTYLPVMTEEYFDRPYYPLKHIVSRFDHYSGTFEDVPLNIPAYQTRGFTYQVYSYIRSAMAFHMLELYLGEENFRNSIEEFIVLWRHKHPTPYDFFNLMQSNTTKDINWIVESWFFGEGVADLAFGSVEMRGDSLHIEIEKKGNMPVPVHIVIQYAEGEEQQFTFPIDVWEDANIFVQALKCKESPVTIILGNEEIPDKYPENNTYYFKD